MATWPPPPPRVAGRLRWQLGLLLALGSGPLASGGDDEQPLAAAPGGACGLEPAGLDCLGARVQNSWTEELEPDSEQERHKPNTLARQVFSGHYVLVRPRPLPRPYLVSHAREVAALLGLAEEQCLSERFLRLFSGDVEQVAGFEDSWATPYALSIYGSEIVPDGAGGDGYGYGDGRAISLGEVVTEGGGRWELQLKGSGPTPFRRRGDGRAVVRSSVREFLASEAMHHLGVPTTRALSLAATHAEHVQRPWYSEGQKQAASQKHGGDVLQEEPCAITTRAAPSFIRVGHFELFGRRARQGDEVGLRQLEQLARHALRREYAHHTEGGRTLPQQLLAMAAEVAERFANMTAEWLRVGYVQSNFNADNCLVSGRTMDYGPFGFIEDYDPGWAMWVGSGSHYAFMNQPRAGGANFKMFARSLEPLLDEGSRLEMGQIIKNYPAVSKKAVQDVFARKLGFQRAGRRPAALWAEAEALLRGHPTDWTVFWRRLADVAAAHSASVRQAEAEDDAGVDVDPVTPLEAAFSGMPWRWPPALRTDWRGWLQRWLAALGEEGDLEGAAARMRLASPKYVPREGILVEAYSAAEKGDSVPLRSIQELFRRPYDEQPLYEDRYFRRREDAAGAGRGGVDFMS